jgi:hypothetical protein
VRFSISPSLIIRDTASNNASSSGVYSLSLLMAIKGPLRPKSSSSPDPRHGQVVTADPTVLFLFLLRLIPVWFEAPSLKSTTFLVEGFRGSAAFNTFEVKVGLVRCALSSSIQLPSESHLFWYVVDSSAVVRSCFTINALDSIMDAKSCLLLRFY